MKYINKHQLFSLMLLFEIGSTTLFALGIKAKQAAWLAILIAMFIGLVFAWLYTELQKIIPHKNYVEIIITILGKGLGVPLSLLYAVYWLWPTVRILRESSELIILTLLPNTPLTIVVVTFTFTSLYVLSLGIQVLARTTEITMPLFVFFIINIFIATLISGNIDLKNLTPVLGNGIKPVLKAAYPTVTIFPFSFILIFSMYWSYVDDKSIIRKTTMVSIIFSGVLLSLTLIIYISVLGVEYSSISTIPFIEIVRMVNIGEFLSNLDSIGASIIFIGGFYMMSVFLNGVTMVLVSVFKIKNYNLLLTIVSFFVIWVSITFEPSYTYHQWMFPFDTIYLHSTFLHIIPLLLFLIHLIKAKAH